MARRLYRAIITGALALSKPQLGIAEAPSTGPPPNQPAPPGQTSPSTGRRRTLTPEQREARWKTHHIDLDLLPVAYAQAPRRIPIGTSLRMLPIGYPAGSYSLYPDFQFRVTPRTDFGLGVTGASPLGRTGTTIFYTMGLQQLLLPETRHQPALAVGGYGFLGPQNLHGGAGYIVASRQVTGHVYPRGAFVHLGLLLQSFGDGRSGTSVRPFIGAHYVWTRRLHFAAEFRPRMSWEAADPYTVRGILLLTRRYGVTGGFRQNGYRARPFIGVEID